MNTTTNKSPNEVTVTLTDNESAALCRVLYTHINSTLTSNQAIVAVLNKIIEQEQKKPPVKWQEENPL